MPYITWQALERHTYSLLNKLEAADGAAAETAITGTAVLTPTGVSDEAFPPAKVRWNIVLAHQSAIALICKTPGHHRRGEYLLSTAILHGGVVPSSLGPRMFSWKDPADVADKTKRRTLVRRPASLIDEIRQDAAARLGVTVLYYDLRGELFVCTVDDSIECEYYDYPMPAKHPSALAALFDTATDEAKIADEFVSPVCNVAAGLSALTMAGGLVAAQFFETARLEYQAQGITVPEADYQAWLRPQTK